ncbi:phytanoyl-CoA dioxygenase family protein [Sulfurimonas sp. HSL3-7]|uniref:phytanoyl-CoA dioxygenase family protein n=1 Tax=Sulfonitrofixus jiaomeiensis TaxID=3131938 RepID=UPI0031F7F882
MRIAPLAKGRLWFEYENYKQHARFLNLSKKEKEIVEQFKKEGCYLYKNAISDDVIDKIDNAVDEWMIDNISGLVANKKPDGTYPRLIGLHEEVPAIQALFSNEVTLRLRELLFGRGKSLYTSITFLQGSQQALHRDIPVFNVSPDNFYFRIWFALEDATFENGTLTGVRGGHRVAADKYRMPHRFYSRFEEIPEQDPVLWRKYQDALKQKYEAAGLREEKIELSKGDLLIWHPLFPHGGSKIEDKKSSRRSVVLHVTEIPPFSQTVKK